MISKETCREIFNCYCEIEHCEEMLENIQKDIETSSSRSEPNPRETRERTYQLGVPLFGMENGRRLYSVKPNLAMSVVKAHIANKKAELAEANEKAKIELGVGQ